MYINNRPIYCIPQVLCTYRLQKLRKEQKEVVSVTRMDIIGHYIHGHS